jgi:8-oxo-dGTP pyrophosphatase MutT (NUDIX family)
LWDSSASGHVDSGEEYDACAVRELYEEIGLSLPSPPQRLFKIAASDRTDQEHVWVYRTDSDGPVTLNKDEIEQGGWYGPGQIARWTFERPAEFSEAFLFIWEKFNGGA